MTERIPDTNGWVEIKNNPLSKIGVFDYSGKAIGAPGLDPLGRYRVLRPEEELSSDECIQSARLLPWTNDHPQVLLGDENDGRIPPEDKGVEGVIGEDIYYKDGTLYGNIKVFSQSMADDINSGKTELSMGYFCRYVREDGTWEGEPYQFRQAGIRFNHLSLVDSGRMGSDVAVLDSIETNKGDIEMEEKKDEEKGVPSQTQDANPAALLDTIFQALTALKGTLGGGNEANPNPAPNPEQKPNASEDANAPPPPDGEKAPADKLISAAEEVIAAAKPDVTVEEEVTDDDLEKNPTPPPKPEDDEKSAMDGAEYKRFMQHIAVRDRLAAALRPHIGTFDHAEMTLSDVASYGNKKLGLKAAPGHEFATLQGYLAAKRPNVPVTATMDSASQEETFIDKYLKGDTK
jgi:hypothetical protein